MKKIILFFIFVFIFKSNSFTIHKIHGNNLKDCRIKIQNLDWYNIKDCDQTEFDEGWGGETYIADNLHYDYNLGDIFNIWIRLCYFKIKIIKWKVECQKDI